MKSTNETEIKIKKPIWHNRSVGLSELYLGRGRLRVLITYTAVGGHAVYPHPYYIDSKRLLDYPVQEVKGNRLRIVPIKDLEIDTKEVR